MKSLLIKINAINIKNEPRLGANGECAKKEYFAY
jgi:hypothetical protein